MHGKHHSRSWKLKMSKMMKGRKMSKEWRERISKSNSGKHHSKASRLKMSKARLGKHLSKATRLKISKAESGKKNWNYGKHWSKATKFKISKALKGIRLSRSHREKISKSMKGNPKFCGRNNANYGKPLSLAHKQKLSEIMTGNPKISGKNSHLWNGGISSRPYGKAFNNKLRREIRERDNYTCQLCNKRGKDVHHIDYSKKNNRPSNLCVLCKSCNVKVNTNRKFWTRYFRKLVRQFKGVKVTRRIHIFI